MPNGLSYRQLARRSFWAGIRAWLKYPTQQAEYIKSLREYSQDKTAKDHDRWWARSQIREIIKRGKRAKELLRITDHKEIIETTVGSTPYTREIRDLLVHRTSCQLTLLEVPIET